MIDHTKIQAHQLIRTDWFRRHLTEHVDKLTERMQRQPSSTPLYIHTLRRSGNLNARFIAENAVDVWQEKSKLSASHRMAVRFIATDVLRYFMAECEKHGADKVLQNEKQQSK